MGTLNHINVDDPSTSANIVTPQIKTENTETKVASEQSEPPAVTKKVITPTNTENIVNNVNKIPKLLDVIKTPIGSETKSPDTSLEVNSIKNDELKQLKENLINNIKPTNPWDVNTPLNTAATTNSLTNTPANKELYTNLEPYSETKLDKQPLYENVEINNIVDQPLDIHWRNKHMRGQYPVETPYNDGPNGRTDHPNESITEGGDITLESPSIMQSVIAPRSTPVQHLAFPVSKQAVKNFREKLEKNIE